MKVPIGPKTRSIMFICGFLAILTNVSDNKARLKEAQ